MASPSTGWHQVYCLVTEAHVRKQQLAKGCTPQRQRQRCEPATCWSKVQQSNHLLLSLHFNGHFPGKPELAGVNQGKGWWRWRWHLVWSHKSCKLQSNHHHQQTNIKFFFTSQMPFLLPNQQCQSTEGEISHSMDLLTPSSPGVFQLCLWPATAPAYLGGGLPCLSSALWCQYPNHLLLLLFNFKMSVQYSDAPRSIHSLVAKAMFFQPDKRWQITIKNYLHMTGKAPGQNYSKITVISLHSR